MSADELEEQAAQFLQIVGARYELPSLAFDGGACILTFDRGNVVTLYPQLEGLHSILMHVLVGVAPLRDPRITGLMAEMLNGNDAWSMTNGSTLGLDKASGMVSLWQRFTLPAASDEEILDALETLLATAEHWRDVLIRHGGAPAFGGEAADAAGEAALLGADRA